MGNRFLFLLLIQSIHGRGFGLEHTVGDSIWSIPPAIDFYANWSSSYSFRTGDTLYFDFDSGFYNVIQVPRGEYDNCDDGSQAFTAFADGPVVFPLSTEGVLYFICNVSNYCRLGMKVSVVVEQRSVSLASPSPSPVADSE